MEKLNRIQTIAKRRLVEIEKSTQRILRKMKQNPHRKADYERRLDEYGASSVALALELKSGVAVKVKDKKQQALIATLLPGKRIPESGGVTVDVPAGKLNMEGK